MRDTLARDFARWFEKLSADLELLAKEPREHLDRILLLHNALIDLLEVLDPGCKRFPTAKGTEQAT